MIYINRNDFASTEIKQKWVTGKFWKFLVSKSGFLLKKGEKSCLHKKFYSTFMNGSFRNIPPQFGFLWPIRVREFPIGSIACLFPRVLSTFIWISKDMEGQFGYQVMIILEYSHKKYAKIGLKHFNVKSAIKFLTALN